MALAMEPCQKEPSSRRRPFMARYRAAHTVGRPTSQVKMASSAAWSLIALAICCGWISFLSGAALARSSSPLRAFAIVLLGLHKMRVIPLRVEQRQQWAERLFDVVHDRQVDRRATS